VMLLAAIAACGRIGYDASVRNDSGTGGGGAAGVAGTGGGAAMGGTGGSASAGTSGAAGAGTSGAAGAGTSGAAGAGTGGSVGTGTGGAGGTGVDGGSCAQALYGGHTYALCDGPLSWNDAQADCVAKGMRLARIDVDAENEWVLTNAFAAVPASYNMSDVWRWLGGSDVAVLGEWRWTDGAQFWMGGSNGSSISGLYSNWVAGAPTNTGRATDCAVMQHNALGFWTDQDCTWLQPYVCEQY